MKVELNSVDAQYWLIYFFSKMLPEQELYVWNMLSRQKIDNKVYQYIQMCMQHGSQVRKNPKYCSDLESTCKTMTSVIMRENNLDLPKKVTQIEYLKAFGSFEEETGTKTLNKQQFNRIKNGKNILDPRFIQSLSEQFQDDIKRRFWRNWILYYWPEVYWRNKIIYSSNTYDRVYVNRKKTKHIINDIKKENNHGIECVSIKNKLRKGKNIKQVTIENENIESKSFDIIMNVLQQNNQSFIEEVIEDENLPQNQKDKIKGLLELHSYDCKTSKLGIPPYKLYEVIKHLRNQVGMSLQQLWEEIGITEPTWYSLKSNWLQAQKTYFEYVSKNILKRHHILLIAIIFELNYMDTLILLQIAGYRMGTNNQDEELMDYFLYGIGSVEKIKVKLFEKKGKD